MIEREVIPTVDTRRYKSGQVRLRFRLSSEAYTIVTSALPVTGYTYPGCALDAIAMSYLAGTPAVAALGIPAQGRQRLLISLWPDQFETVRLALDVIRQFVQDDHTALVAMCAAFVETEFTNQPMKENRYGY